MHELAIAQKLIATATALIPPGANCVTSLKVHLGTLAGLAEEELRFGFDVMAKDTACATATLLIEIVPAAVHCPECGRDFPVNIDEALLCPACASPAVIVIQGKELIIASMEVSVDEPLPHVREAAA